MVTIEATPAKLAEVPAATWHATQLAEMPEWLIREFAKRAPSVTGRLAMLEPAPTWHSSQGADVGRWFDGMPITLKPIDGIAKLAAAALLWHCTQLPVLLGALAWIAVSEGTTAKSPLVWQAVQVALAAVGM